MYGYGEVCIPSGTLRTILSRILTLSTQLSTPGHRAMHSVSGHGVVLSLLKIERGLTQLTHGATVLSFIIGFQAWNFDP